MRTNLYPSRLFSALYPKRYDLFAFILIEKADSSKENSNLNSLNSKIISSSNDISNFYLQNLKISLKRNNFSIPDYLTSLRIPLKSFNSEKLNSSNFCEIENTGKFWGTCETTLTVLQTANKGASAHFFSNMLVQSLHDSSDLSPFQNYRKSLRLCLRIAKESPLIRGIRIVSAGRFNGAERARREIKSWGRTSLNEFDSYLDYSPKTALTNTGLFGVKVWVLYLKK